MKDMADLKKWIRDEMRQSKELEAGYTAAGNNAMAKLKQGKVDALSDVHSKLCIYFPEKE